LTVQLTSIPSADVSIQLASSDTSEGTVSPATLVFTPVNSLTPQIVTITGIDDPSDDGDVAYKITMTATSEDPDYDGIAIGEVSVVNSDDDSGTSSPPLDMGDAPTAEQSGFLSDYPTVCQCSDGARHVVGSGLLSDCGGGWR
jgi:hypothetical protein